MLNKRKYKLFIFLSGLVMLGIGIYLVVAEYPSRITWKSVSDNQVQVSQYFSVLDGLPVSSTEMIKPYVVGVMIDNHPDARPQSGLGAAKIIYEAPAEGGITRYFAIFDSEQKIEKIGPVRSARPYFIDWLEEYDGLYMHCGGSPEALTRLKIEPIFDLNEMTNGVYFWRDTNRAAPHNLYTNSEKWNKALAANLTKKKLFDNAWQFGGLASSSLEAVKNMTIEYAPDYLVNWRYDENLKQYSRYINDQIMSEGGDNLLADDVVVQYVKSQVVDDYGRREITTSGQGELRLLRDGVMMRGVWKKENGRTRFYDLNGQVLNLKPGKIWIQIVPKEINIKIST